MLRTFPEYSTRTRREKKLAPYYAIRAAVPEGSIISAPGSAFPALWKNRTVYFFPIGIEIADYAIPHASSYMGAENEKLLNQNLLLRMRNEGYDMDHPILLTGGTQLFKHIRKQEQRRNDTSDSATMRNKLPAAARGASK